MQLAPSHFPSRGNPSDRHLNADARRVDGRYLHQNGLRRSFGNILSTTAISIALCSTLAHATEWVLTYDAVDVVAIGSPDGVAPSRTETRTYTQTIALSEHIVSVQDERRRLVYDFQRRRFVNLDLASNTYRDLSLFALPDFFEAEIRNRNFLGAAMRAAKVDQASATFRRFDSESELRVESPRHPANSPAPIIEQAEIAGGLEFRHDGRTAVRFVPAAAPIPPGLHPRFINYLAHSCAIHPEIRRRIADTGAIPQELVFTWRAVNRETSTTLRLVSSHASNSNSSKLPATAKPAAADTPVLQLLEFVNTAEKSGQRPTRADTAKFARSRIEEGQVLDGLLTLLEYGLQTGEQLPDEIRKYRKHYDKDERTQHYLRATDQSSKAACEQSLAINATIDRTNLQKAHILELQRANHLDRLGKSEEALEAYISVVRANPFHAGALHDLGMLLTRTYDHATGWQCWDAARRLYPKHSMFHDVVAREQKLVADHPDFF
jgi:tetratricopeptide (TPR) repeat protein